MEIALECRDCIIVVYILWRRSQAREELPADVANRNLLLGDFNTYSSINNLIRSENGNGNDESQGISSRSFVGAISRATRSRRPYLELRRNDTRQLTAHHRYHLTVSEYSSPAFNKPNDSTEVGEA
jgi:hypothetical protein